MSTLAHIDGIESLIMEEDADMLRKYSALVTADGICLEIGSYQGASAYSILQGLPVGYDLVCASQFWSEEYSKFRNLMLRKRLWQRVVPITGDFRMIWERVKPGPVAFAFIDHDHTEQGMQDVFDLILPNCARECIVMFHDYGHPGYPAVKYYVDQLNSKIYKKLEVSSLMAVLMRL